MWDEYLICGMFMACIAIKFQLMYYPETTYHRFGAVFFINFIMWPVTLTYMVIDSQNKQPEIFKELSKNKKVKTFWPFIIKKEDGDNNKNN